MHNETCAVNLQQSRYLVGVKELVKSSVLHSCYGLNLFYRAKSRKTFRGLHGNEGMFMHFTRQGENQLSVAK